MQTKPHDAGQFVTVLALVTVVTAGIAMQPAVGGAAAPGSGGASTPASAGSVPGSLAVQQGGEVTLENTTVTQQRGDVVAFNLSFSEDASVARVTLGSAELNFEVQLAVWDRDGDGTVTVLWDTARSAERDAGLSVAPGDGDRRDVLLQGPTVLDGVSRPVEPADYPVTVENLETGNVTDLGTVFVEERSAESLTVHTAPASEGPFDSASAVEDAASVAEAGETIAVGEETHDWVVLRLAASGLSGSLGEVTDLDDPSDGVSLTLAEREASVGMNEEPVQLRLDGNVTLHRAGDDVYLLVLSAAALREAGADVGDEFEATFAVTGDHALAETPEHLSASFTLVEGAASFDLGDGQLAVDADTAAEVTGTSTWAPGTELLVNLYAAGEAGAPSVTAEAETAVGQDGNWSATVDLSDASSGQQVTARLFHLASNDRLAITEGEVR